MKSIEIKNLTKRIRNSVILDNINLDFEKGTIYGIKGRNGSGKTMLLRAICGLIVPTEGAVFFKDKELHKDISIPPSIGVLIESPGFWKNYSGFENLKILSSIKNKITDKDILQTLDDVGLNPNDKKPYKKYSLGMKQKLGIAQALMEKPEVILLDEPTNALDEESVKSIRKLLLREKDRGATILIASHNTEDIESICDYKLEIDNGKIKNNSFIEVK